MIDSDQKSQFAKREEEILKFWQDKKIFEKSLKKKAPKGDYVFYDGPPFATGTPHYGHIVASLMKDAVPRFWTMNGYHVSRRWGWDCHGLPIENLVEEELNLKTKKDIDELGIEKFCDTCRQTVLRYANEWEKTIPRFGRWVDMDNAFKTMDKDYMESVWWVFKTLYDKGLIYQGYKAMHICPRCETTLSNFEVTQNYKDITDISVVAMFKLKEKLPGDKLDTYILAWTTTPWTLPGNVALAMGKDIEYVKVLVGKEWDGYYVILAKTNLQNIIKDREHKIISSIKAKDLEGKKYEPLFDYFINENLEYKKKLYTIQLADFVTVQDGTGVVHIAPGFGEDDLNLAKEKKLPTIIHVTSDGRFIDKIKDWPNRLVKPQADPADTDRLIFKYLKDKKGLIFGSEIPFEHSYPHCWRCDTPLLNYAATSWFVKVTAIKKDLLKNNEKTNWIPKHLKAGRFGKWLAEAKDWAISRNRFWGDPLPVWICQKNLKSKISNLKTDENGGCGNIKVIGSVKELEKLSGKKIDDLHKPTVDKIVLDCKKCGGKMRRIPEVLDCWFESGSMPYSQEHFPFKLRDDEKIGPKTLPADFIAEGVDQTRGWFYTLMVLSTALFNKSTFKNVIANGIVLAENGQKMSKRLKNYPEPDLIIDKYGADALRYYLLTSPVMEAESLNFSEQGVKEALQKVVMLLNNVLNFYSLLPKTKNSPPKPKNILDRWILAKLNLLTKDITNQMKNYQLVNACRPIGEFVNELSTWYLRRSRERFKAGDKDGINTLSFVLLEFSKIIAPFLPFTAEEIHQKIGGKIESVHLEDWPAFAKASAGEAQLLKEMELIRQIVEKGLAARAEAGIKVRQPLAKLKIKSQISNLKNNEDLINLIKDELNVKEIIFDSKIKKEVEIDTNITEELKQEGLLRDLIRQINQLRKEKCLTINDKIMLYYQGEGLKKIFKNFEKKIKKATLVEKIKESGVSEMKELEDGKIGIEKIS